MPASISPTLRRRLSIAALAVLVGAFLVFTAVPGTFTTDENQYNLAAARFADGELAVPGYDGNPHLHGLNYFGIDPPGVKDPPRESKFTKYSVPPLHAVFALPFVGFGWFGLVALNVLAFLAAAAAVYLYARDFSTRPQTPMLALLAFAVGNFLIEYAQGTWPHMLSVGLIAVGIYCAALARRDDRFALAAVAGLVLGAAVGVRFQNIVLLGAGLLTFLLARKFRLAGAAIVGAALPLAGIATINLLRSGVFRLTVRGGGYMRPSLGGSELPKWQEPFAVFWAKVVDYTTHPAIGDPAHTYLTKDAVTGAILLGQSLKKAWIQSSPWVAIALLGLVLAWRITKRTDDDVRSRQQRELRALGVFLFPMLAALCIAGFARTDGGAFNQRYFLEMTPIAAIAFALLLERAAPIERLPALAGAGVVTIAVAGMLTSAMPGSTKIWFVMLAPLVIGAMGLLAWLQSHRIPRLLSVAVGAMLAWGFTLHLLDDMQASRYQRVFNALRRDAVAEAFRSPAAVFAYSYNKDALGPLQLEQDLLIIESGWDSLPRLQQLARSLADQGRHIYVLTNDMPEPLAAGLASALGGTAPRERVYQVGADLDPFTVIEVSPGKPIGTAAAN